MSNQSPEGLAERACRICHAGVSVSDEAMACHCAEMPWFLRNPTALRDHTGAGDALLAADRVVSAFERFNDAEHNRQDCPECSGEGNWVECEPCSDRVGELLNDHLLAIEAFKAARTRAPEPFDRKAVLEEAAAVLRKVADDLAHEPRPEFDDHAQFQAGRAHQAHLDEKAIRALSTKDGAADFCAENAQKSGGVE